MAKDEFIHIGLHVLLAHTVMCSLNPGFQVAEGLMDMFQLTGLHHLVSVTFLCQFVVADEPVGCECQHRFLFRLQALTWTKI